MQDASTNTAQKYFFSKYAPLNLFQFIKKTLMENFTADLAPFTEES